MGWSAVVAASGALIVASFTLYVTAPWFRPLVDELRRELRGCERDRRELRLSLQLVVGALLSLLPHESQLELLAKLDKVIVPDEGEHQD